MASTFHLVSNYLTFVSLSRGMLGDGAPFSHSFWILFVGIIFVQGQALELGR